VQLGAEIAVGLLKRLLLHWTASPLGSGASAVEGALGFLRHPKVAYVGFAHM